MVSSTQPRFGPRCPPVFATLETSASRISAGEDGQLLGRERTQILGAPERLQERHGSAVSSLRRDDGGRGGGRRPTVAAQGRAGEGEPVAAHTGWGSPPAATERSAGSDMASTSTPTSR